MRSSYSSTTLFFDQPAGNSPAATANGLNYTANLYVFALRPRNINDPTAGYYKTSFIYPFSFRLEQTVTDLSATSSSYAFTLEVPNMQITLGQNIEILLETTISSTSGNSPDLGSFALVSYPDSAQHTTYGVAPILTRISDNGNCPSTSVGVPCVIEWNVTVPELSFNQAGGTTSAYNQQYIGEWTFSWITSIGSSPVEASLVIDAVAANATSLGQINVPSAVYFFSTESEMLNTNSSGLANPTFTSGDKIWVRHSFLVNQADISAYTFSFVNVWVCYSTVPGFTPTLANGGTGCSKDIPGVMQASLGQRILLYNVSVGGIANFVAPAGSTQVSKIWDWTLVSPTNPGWLDNSTTNTGFGINALPLVFDNNIHTYYFHLISSVAQAPLARRKKANDDVFIHESLIERQISYEGASGVGLQGFAIDPQSVSTLSSAATRVTPSWLTSILSV